MACSASTVWGRAAVRPGTGGGVRTLQMGALPCAPTGKRLPANRYPCQRGDSDGVRAEQDRECHPRPARAIVPARTMMLKRRRSATPISLVLVVRWLVVVVMAAS